MPRAPAKKGAVKRRAPKKHKLPERFPAGEILQGMGKKMWQLGEVIGQGGFGLIYKAYDVTDGPADLTQPYVIKIEPLENGPLFCEQHFYQRVARPEYLTDWSKMKKLRYLAVPPFWGWGLHEKDCKSYRFIVLQHLSTDLYKVLEQQSGRCFSEKTTFSIGRRMLDALEYIHDKGYCHADIKSANILLGYHGGKTDFNQVYLVDYGLAYRFLVDGTQKPYKEDPKKAHDGTAEYASRDAHKGVWPARRGDLEILGYCMLEWLTGSLPWSKFREDKDKVLDLKMKYMNDLPGLFKTFGSKPCPDGLKKYFDIVSKLAYDEKPNYNQLRQFLRSGANNEWVLGLPEAASPSKGVKRKSDSAGPSTPKKRSRPSSSPVAKRQPASKGSSSKAAASASGPALVNGSGKASTPRSKASKPRGKAKPATPKKRGKAGARRSPAVVKPSPSKAQVKIPGAVSGKTDYARVTASAAKGKSPGAGRGRKPGAASGKTDYARVTPSAAKGKSPGAGRGRKQTPRSAVSSPAGSRSGSATKLKARTVQKRKRNKMATLSDTAVQTSPGFGLSQNAV